MTMMPTSTTQVGMPKLTIPTGYEAQQRAAASKRKLAEAMLSQGLASDPNMTSWMQVLGHLGQAWAGKSMDKEADRMDADLSAKVLGDYSTKRQAFLADAQTMTPQELVQKYGAEPMLQEDLKPYAEAFGSNLKQAGELTNFGGRMVRKGDVVGQYANDPNRMVFVNPDGTTSLNPVAVTAAGLASGNLTPTGGYQTTGQMPGMQRLIGAMGGQGQGQSQAPNPEQIMAQARAVGTGQADPSTIGARAPDGQTPDGRPVWKINGQFYDNPEGR